MGTLRIASQTLPSSLRRKTLLIVAVTMIGLVGGLYLISSILLHRGFGKLEEQFARENVERAASAVSNDLSTLDRTTSEYAAWDQTYEYVQGKRPTYEKTEFPAPTFQQLQILFPKGSRSTWFLARSCSLMARSILASRASLPSKTAPFWSIPAPSSGATTKARSPERSSWDDSWTFQNSHASPSSPTRP